MGERIKTYRRRIDELVERDDLTREQWERAIEEHLQQIEFFMHERLIHLIVTMTVAILVVLSIGGLCISQYLPLVIVCILLLGLFIPYIFHYFTLENELQRMYPQYDKMLAKREACRAAERQGQNQNQSQA